MFEFITLGIIQGIAEWLPVSSEGLIVLARTHLFSSTSPLEDTIKLALYLHLGTFLAAFLYFKKDVKRLLTGCFRFSSSDSADQKTIIFLITSTILSGMLGILLLKGLSEITAMAESAGHFITIVTGCLLVITGALELRAKKSGHRGLKDLSLLDGILLGIVQGLAVLPGFSRSGLTVSALLLRNIDRAQSLQLSFLMSLPIVLAGNIILNANMFSLSLPSMAGLLFSFVFGLLTIHAMLKIARTVNFGWFVLCFGALVAVTAFI